MSTERFSQVLVVEDSPTELRLLCDILRDEGFYVIGCGSASEALEHVQQSDFGVAVVDFRLPDLSGTQRLQGRTLHFAQWRALCYHKGGESGPWDSA